MVPFLYFKYMRILVTADIHCGYPNRLKDNIWSMVAMSKYATKNNIEKILCLGDFFHNRDHLTLDVLNATHLFFKATKQEWIMFPGNHDMFMKTSWKINSIRPLEKYATTYDKISSFELDGRNFVVVPFMHYEAEYMDTIRELENKYDENSILLTHIGVNNAVNNSCFLLKNWSNVNLSDIKFSLVLSGHFHNYQVIDDKICYPGSPIPFRFDEGMVPHGFLDVDTDSLSVNFIDFREIRDDCPHDFITITDDIIEKSLNTNVPILNGNHKVRVVLNKEYSQSELENIRDTVIAHGAISVSWMKLRSEECEYQIEQEDKNDTTPPFIRWLDTQNNTKYDRDLLINLYDDISKEAEDKYIQSDEEDNE